MPRKRVAQSRSRGRKRVVFASAAAVLASLAAYGYLSSPGEEERSLALHIHAKVEIFIDGQRITIPANIGIDSALWKSHSLDHYGMPNMSPLHTHDAFGTIHVESTAVRDFTVGQFFEVWGKTFNPTCILDRCSDATHALRMFVNGVRNFDFERYVMRDGDHIVIDYR